MPNLIRVLIADSEPLFCLGIQKAIETTNKILCVKIVTTSSELLETYTELHPDVILLGCCWQDTSTAKLVAILRQRSPSPFILAILSGSKMEMQILTEAGISGAILRNERPEKFLQAFKAVASNELWFSSTITKCLLEPSTLPPLLNEREQLLLALLVSGEPDAIMADRLSVSEVTVRRYIKTLCERFQVETRIQLAYQVGKARLLD